MQNTSKHVQGVTAQSAEDARVQIELAALIAGGKDELRTRPLFSVVACPLAPLTYEEGSVEAQVELAKAGIPVASMSMSMGGTSAPLTVAGMLVNANTENLGSIVISQMAAPGAPHIYCSESAPMDLRTGSINYNAVEKSFLSIGLKQMADRYRLPSLVADAGFGKDIEGGISGLMIPVTQIIGIMGGSDIVTGMGSVDSAKGISLEQCIVDCYLWDLSKTYLHEVEVSADKIGLPVVREVGHGNHFLAHPHTIKHLRGELVSWEQEKLDLLHMDKKELPAEANRIVKNILEEHQVEPISDDVIEKGDVIIKRYEDTVSGPGLTT
jgi:trimethylamine--corrinoid protein Co-methyltransferase